MNNYPALYKMEPIGVNDTLEAVSVHLFCSEDCRANYPRTGPTTEDEAPPDVDGRVCDTCGRKLLVRVID